MIPIRQIYNDALKCSKISNDIIITPNKIQFVITQWIGFYYDVGGYEVIITPNEINTRYIEPNDDNTYHRTKLIYNFIEVLDHNSLTYKNIYEKLKPLLKTIKRDEKLNDLLNKG